MPLDTTVEINAVAVKNAEAWRTRPAIRQVRRWPLVDGCMCRRSWARRIATHISCHSFRATGITTYLQNGGRLEVAQQMAGHESARTTGLYDRRNDAVELDEVERVVY